MLAKQAIQLSGCATLAQPTASVSQGHLKLVQGIYNYDSDFLCCQDCFSNYQEALCAPTMHPTLMRLYI